MSLSFGLAYLSVYTGSVIPPQGLSIDPGQCSWPVVSVSNLLGNSVLTENQCSSGTKVLTVVL